MSREIRSLKKEASNTQNMVLFWTFKMMRFYTKANGIRKKVEHYWLSLLDRFGEYPYNIFRTLKMPKVSLVVALNPNWECRPN